MKFTFCDLNMYLLKCAIQWVLVNSQGWATSTLSFGNTLTP